MGDLLYNKVCVILGAGASHDIKTQGSRIINELCQPPLAASLFNIRNDMTWQAIAPYTGARFLRAKLESDTASGVTFEDALRNYASHQSKPIRESFKHVPPYLRDLLCQCSEYYIRDPDGYIQLVTELLAESDSEVLFLTLNYDDLLERALSAYSPIYSFNNMHDYISADGAAKVVKLHGSINWFKRLSTLEHGDWQHIVDQLDLSQMRSDSEVIITNKIDKVCSKSFNNRWLYPVLTAPLAGKGLTDAVCPPDHIRFTAQFLATCSKILVIGTSGLDVDLLTLLEDSIPSGTARLIHFVGYDATLTSDALTRFKRQVTGFRNNPLLTAYDGGFQKYVGGPDYRRFVQSPS